MARLENATNWCLQAVEMRLHGSLHIPEILTVEPSTAASHNLFTSDNVFAGHETSSTGVPTPTHQTYEERPRLCISRPPWLSQKHFLYGGPGFSLALLDATTGSVDRLPIPVPKLVCSASTDLDAFSSAEVLSVALVGESQMWIGTECGSVHTFEVTPDLRLSKPSYTKVDGPVLCIAHAERASSNTDSLQQPRIEVVMGTLLGNIVIFAGVSDHKGGLKNAFKNPRSVIQLGNYENEICSVNCIIPVDTDTYWCASGGNIVVLRRSNWKELNRLDGRSGCPSNPLDADVIQLVHTEHGVWSCLSRSSTVSLWDTKEFASKVHITCCHLRDTSMWLDEFAQVTALHFSYPLLFIGTNGGHLLVFNILQGLPTCNYQPTSPDTTYTRHSNGPVEYKLLTATHCGPHPIVGIHTSQLRVGLRRSLRDSPLNTPAASQHILVTCGQQIGEETISSSQVQLYELVTSSSYSPVVSPSTGQPAPEKSLSSSGDGPLQRKRNSIVRRISLHSVSSNPLTFLPLQD